MFMRTLQKHDFVFRYCVNCCIFIVSAWDEHIATGVDISELYNGTSYRSFFAVSKFKMSSRHF